MKVNLIFPIFERNPPLIQEMATFSPTLSVPESGSYASQALGGTQGNSQALYHTWISRKNLDWWGRGGVPGQMQPTKASCLLPTQQ